jgi:hypothetical protein
MHDFDVKVDASIASDPPDRALLPNKVQFDNVAVDDTKLSAPPFPAAELLNNEHAFITNVDDSPT